MFMETRVLSIPYDNQSLAAPTPWIPWPRANGKSAVAAKRRCFWANVDRNRRVAELAESFVASAWQTFQGLKIEDTLITSDIQPTVAVLVEVAEQGRQLERFLSKWQVCDAIPTGPDYEPPDNGHDEIKLPGRIMTLAYLFRYKTAADIVIRATGGHGSLHWIEMSTGARGCFSQPRWIIDVADEHDGCLDVSTAARQNEYLEAPYRIERPVIPE